MIQLSSSIPQGHQKLWMKKPEWRSHGFPTMGVSSQDKTSSGFVNLSYLKGHTFFFFVLLYWIKEVCSLELGNRSAYLKYVLMYVISLIYLINFQNISYAFNLSEITQVLCFGYFTLEQRHYSTCVHVHPDVCYFIKTCRFDKFSKILLCFLSFDNNSTYLFLILLY